MSSVPLQKDEVFAKKYGILRYQEEDLWKFTLWKAGTEFVVQLIWETTSCIARVW
ncbi:MAG: hypothetical protein ACK55Z_19785 [bacterium]